MIQDIINGITATIGAEYGEGYEIYTESIAQGLQEPCFFIALLEPEQRQWVGNRYMLTVPVDVHYFPGTKAKNAEMNRVASNLLHLMRRITLIDGTMLNGFSLHFEIIDDVLHFFVTFKPIISYPAQVDELMGELVHVQKAGD